MPFRPSPEASRCAVVDLGSNSVRLVVYEGNCRNPVAIFNEKAVLRLGRGLEATGRLNEDGVDQAITVMRRYRAVATAMGADPLEVLATAAVRDAANGPDFVRTLSSYLPGVPIRVLSGDEEGEYSALGVLCGIPQADGVLAGIGGGSLELVRIEGGRTRQTHTVGLGVIRLAERAGGDPGKAREVAERDLAPIGWLKQGEGRELYLVGGAWRALARVHMAQVGYPLHMVHHYTIGREEARELGGMIAGAGRRAVERLPAVPRRRADDLPYAAVVLRRVPTGNLGGTRGVQRERAARGLVHATPARTDPRRGPADRRRPRLRASAWTRSGPAATSDHLDRSVVSARSRRAAPAA